MTKDKEFADLRNRIKQPNFVYTVGYSLEKVHSGVLAYLLESRHGPNLIANLSGKFNPSDVVAILVQREDKLGKGCVVDLTVTVKLRDNSDRHFVCEYKVDGTGRHDEQCKRIKTNREDDDKTEFLLITPGGAGFWTPPHGFRQLDVEDLLTLLRPYRSTPLADQYVSALEDEKTRRDIAHQIIADSELSRSSLARNLGYRKYDLWYDYYGKLKQMLPNASRVQWNIYSTAHNPVMCWSPSWDGIPGDERNNCRLGRLYCELNYSNLYLKIHWNGAVERRAFITVVNAIRNVLEGMNFHTQPCLSQSHETNTWAKRPLTGDPPTVASLLHRFTSQEFLPLCGEITRQLK